MFSATVQQSLEKFNLSLRVFGTGIGIALQGSKFALCRCMFRGDRTGEEGQVAAAK